jgi:hypothetical protein
LRSLPPGGVAMTKDELFCIKLNIAHYEAMLNLDIDVEKRLIVEQLIAEAKDMLAAESKKERQVLSTPR